MIWTTKKGERLTEKKMTDEHIKNAINMQKGRLENLLADMGSCYGHGFSCDSMAAYAAEQEGDAIGDRMDSIRTSIDIFERELSCRAGVR